MKNRASIETNAMAPRDIVTWDDRKYWQCRGWCQSGRVLNKTVCNCEAVGQLCSLLCCLATRSSCKIKLSVPNIRTKEEYVFGSVCVIPSATNFLVTKKS